jgi:hypothetical protein
MNGLLYSRKFWLCVFGILQAVVLHYLDVPNDIWQSVAALVAVLIASIAYEDGQLKRSWIPPEDELQG